ncbi:MAG: PD40 domain-containing protein [Parabacteroides sp.]|nr:PD40 domain-containing protein [Parabacteroides sp.]
MKQIIYYLLLLLLIIQSGCNRPSEIQKIDGMPPIYPDYTNITIPYNIAPLNFLLRNKPQSVEVSVKGKNTSFVVYGNEKIQFPERKWRSLLESEKGNDITVEVTVEKDGKWYRYAAFKWKVSIHKIDSYLSYRRIEPGYEVWNKIQICQRNLENFSEKVLADNNLTDGSCMNCHIYNQHQKDVSLFHLRGKKGGTILNRNGKLRKLNTKGVNSFAPAVYGAFHPSGRFGVFSQNTIIPEFHAYRSERLEVYDTASDLVILDFDENSVNTSSLVSGDQTLETFPVFSADGKSVYYCAAPQLPLPDSIRSLRYSLMRIDFDEKSGKFGNKIDTILSANSLQQSVSFPKVSPNGRFLLFCVSDYGTFPIWHNETDLRMLDLKTGGVDSLKQVNAWYSDSYHSWSSESRWFVFASKRDNGIYGKPYFSYIDNNGVASKPFVLPQKDPAYYDYTLISFNIPELSKDGVSFGAMDVEDAYFNLPTDEMK